MVVGGGCSCREEGWLKMEEKEEEDRMVGGEDFGGSDTMEKKENAQDDCKVIISQDLIHPTRPTRHGCRAFICNNIHLYVTNESDDIIHNSTKV
ncbi:hypothetical protein MTR_3g101450 [Medicago truncatula]|uniref:Uncharacterized protein n=1 Tax=Medicago truncatula TaxID=3880 RepID=G7J6B3_MEDTR|nr:hypothetical protein MTR_3g101450 [Medicago truncatula]